MYQLGLFWLQVTKTLPKPADMKMDLLAYTLNLLTYILKTKGG